MIIKNVNFEKMKRDAWVKARRMVDNGLYSRFRLSDRERVAKAQLGCIGERAFESFLQDLGVSYQIDNGSYENRNTDEFDFYIHRKKIDVKVAKKSTSNAPNDRWTYGYPQEQHPISKDFVVVGWVDFANQEIGFYGWMTGARIAEYPIRTKNSFRGYAYLTPNHEFQWGDMNKNFGQLFYDIYR